MYAIVPSSRSVCLHCQLRRTLRSLQRGRLPRSALAAGIATAALPSISTHGSRVFELRRRFSARVGQPHDVYSAPASDNEHEQTQAHENNFDNAHQVPGQPATAAAAEKLTARGQFTIRRIYSRESEENGQVQRASNITRHRRRRVPNSTRIRLQDAELFGDPMSITRLANPENKDPRALELEEEDSMYTDHKESNIFELLQQDSSEPSPEELVEGIDAIRDRWLASIDPDSVPTRADCIRIFNHLMESFNSSQLQKYLKETERDEADEFDDLLGVFADETCMRSKWYVGHTPLLSTFAERLFAIVPPRTDLKVDQVMLQEAFKSKSTAALTKKPSTAASIIRDSWRIIAAEESKKSGELDIALRPENHAFLHSRLDIFRQIEQQYGVKTEYNSEANALRIRGSFDRCGNAFTALYAPLHIIRTKRIEISNENASLQRSAPLWKLSVLDDVGAFTKSQVSQVVDEAGNLTGFDVMFLGPRRTKDNIDMTTFNQVHRLIDDIAYGQSHSSEVHLLSNVPVPFYQAPVQGETALPIHHRNSSLYRFCSDPTQLADSKQENLDAAETLRLGVDMGSKLLQSWNRLGRREPNHRRHVMAGDHQQWSTTITPSLTVRTGQLGFDDPEKLEPLLAEVEDRSDEQRERVKRASQQELFRRSVKEKQKLFVPALPGGISIFERLNGAETYEEQRVVLILKPSQAIESGVDATAGTTSTLALPDLHLELEPSQEEQGALVMREARLASALQPVQVALPSEAFDLQIESRQFLSTLQDSAIDQHMKDFIDQIALRSGRVDERSIPTIVKVTIAEPARHINDLNVHNAKQKRRCLSGTNAARIRSSMFDSPGQEDENKSQTIQQQGGLLDECQLVNYQFSRVEHHSRLHGRFQGFPLTYSIIDAGSMGRQWEQLTLEARPAEDAAESPSGSPIPDRTVLSHLDQIDQPGEERLAYASASTHWSEIRKGNAPALVTSAMESAAEIEARSKHARGAKADVVAKKAAEAVWAEYASKLEQNADLAWFLDYFQAALNMARESR